MFEKLNCKIVSVICQLTVLLGTKLFQQKGSSRGHKSLPNHAQIGGLYGFAVNNIISNFRVFVGVADKYC